MRMRIKKPTKSERIIAAKVKNVNRGLKPYCDGKFYEKALRSFTEIFYIYNEKTINKRFMRLLTLLMICIASVSLGQSPGRIEILEPNVFETKLKHIRHTLVDLRSGDEFIKSTIEGSINLDWTDKLFVNNTASLKNYEPLFIFCGNGEKSKIASKWLTENGFTTVIVLEGGFENWLKLSKKTIKPDVYIFKQ